MIKMKKILPSNAGAPLKIPSPDDLWARFIEYYEDAKSTPFKVKDFVGKDGKEVDREKERPLSIDGFEVYLCDYYGISTAQQYLENRDGRYSQFVSIIAYIKKVIRKDQIEGGMSGIYHPNLTARINGISDKVDQTVQSNVKLLNIDPLNVDSEE